MTITALPPAPSRGDPATFSAKSDALLGALDLFVTETNSTAATAVAAASTATTQAGYATSQATASQNSALAAGAVAWVTGTTYAIGDVRFSPVNLQTYRRKTAGAGATDPSADATNWQVLTGTMNQVKAALAANNIDLSTANYFSKTIAAITTLTVSNTPGAGTVASFILDLTNGGAYAVTWWAGVKWPLGIAPTLTAAGRDVLGFFTHDGGATWSGFNLGRGLA
jgi:hypothetical protein